MTFYCFNVLQVKQFNGLLVKLQSIGGKDGTKLCDYITERRMW
jgi:hypothetical protein